MLEEFEVRIPAGEREQFHKAVDEGGSMNPDPCVASVSGLLLCVCVLNNS
jgi:hypothetical protein